jgi:hypothetical protein
LGTQDTGRRQSRDTGHCFQCLWIVFVLCLVYPLLPVSLDCLRPVSCVPNVTSVSGLSSSCVLCTKCYQCLWIVFVLCLVYPMLPVSLDCLRPVSCVPNVTSVSGLSSSCFLCTQCYPIQRHGQHWVHKTQDEDNPETLVTLGTQDRGRRQSRETGNIGYTRHRTRTIHVLCLLYPMLSVSLNCLRSVSCVPNVTSVSGLSSFCVLCTQCYQCLWIVFVLCLVYPMLSVSLYCPRPVYCVPNVTSFSGLSSSCVLCTQCCRCLCIVLVLCLVYPMLPVSLDYLRHVSSIGYTRHRTKTIQRHW